jgi:hypothetical protein
VAAEGDLSAEAGAGIPAELDTLAERLGAQLLTGAPAASAEQVTERLLAIQAQDPRGARLAVRARTTGLTGADVDDALNGGELLITWLGRGTLHLVRVEDYPWLHALTTPPLRAGNARRLAQEGVEPNAAERGVEVIERALAEAGPLTRAQLRARLDEAGVRTQGQALVHILLLASLRGLIVRGPMQGSEHAFALVRDWLGEPAAVDRDRARAELARRYLAGHGPADARDLARWAGLPLKDARAGLAAIATELVERPDGLVDLRACARSNDGLPPPRLLGPFEPLLLGWCSREVVVQEHQGIVTTNGIFRSFALVDGRAAGLWSMRAGRVAIEPFAPLATGTEEALNADARDVERFLKSTSRTGRDAR